MPSAASILKQEISSRGPISFARFMEVALYHPEHGYYARADRASRTGKKGDFFTSVSVGSLFGRLLARQFEAWWRSDGTPGTFRIVEAGGMDGALAKDVLQSATTDFPAFRKAMRYTIVEPLPSLKALQQRTLEGMEGVSWADSIRNLPPEAGVVFGNELLDAFPVHLIARDAKGEWVERSVDVEAEKFVWCESRCDAALHAGLPANLSGAVEVSPAGASWMGLAAKILKHGRMLFLDYGFSDEEYFQVERPWGTLRAYRAHQRSEDLLAEPGEQDLTAHVRWTPLLEGAERDGLKREEWIQQGRWLGRIFTERPFELSAAEKRQFQTLTHPQMLGHPFRALVLKKDR